MHMEQESMPQPCGTCPLEPRMFEAEVESDDPAASGSVGLTTKATPVLEELAGEPWILHHPKGVFILQDNMPYGHHCFCPGFAVAR